MLWIAGTNAPIRSLSDSPIRNSNRSGQSDSSPHSLVAGGHKRGNRNVCLQEPREQRPTSMVWRIRGNCRVIYSMSDMRGILPIDYAWSLWGSHPCSNAVVSSSCVHRCGASFASNRPSLDRSEDPKWMRGFLGVSSRQRGRLTMVPLVSLPAELPR